MKSKDGRVVKAADLRPADGSHRGFEPHSLHTGHQILLSDDLFSVQEVGQWIHRVSFSISYYL